VTKLDRREFLKMAGITVGGAGMAAASGLGLSAMAGGRAKAASGGGHMAPSQDTHGVDVDAMVQGHQAGVDIFLAGAGQDPNFWTIDAEYTMEDGVKVFNLVGEEVNWDVGGGKVVPAMTFNGIVPGPTIRVTEGDRFRLNFTNNLTQPTGLHFHGLMVPNNMDGVPMVTQPAVLPGETYTYEFPIREGNIGSHMYHSHFNAAEQTARGFLGAFIVSPRDTSREPVVQGDYIMVLNDAYLGLTFNGKEFPYTQPIIGKLGDTIRIRYMNEGFQIHPMHLHGLPQQVIAQDGFYLPQPYWCDTLNVAPGQRLDVLVPLTEPGVWAFHCHILNHAEGPNGMFGMVTVLIVQE
jgi:manganese oxidase